MPSLSARKKQRRRIPIERPCSHRYDAVREVACEEVGAAYGAVLVNTGRRIVVASINADGTVIRSLLPDTAVSYEINERGDGRGFLQRGLIRWAAQEGFSSRTTKRELESRAGRVTDPDEEEQG